MQGDVLERTSAIDNLLKVVHPHFHGRMKNLFFMVLTQSCDLVQRKAGGGCKAPYITIAPVRSLDSVIERHLAQLPSPNALAEVPVLSAKAKSKASEFLVRLFNNNEQGYFYLDGEDTVLPCQCVAFLNLSIAIKANEHYGKCLEAKRLQLTDVFQAKLGWLVGQIYSRVGTDDLPQEVLTKKVQSALKDAALWIDDSKVTVLEEAYAQLNADGQGVPMTSAQVAQAISRAKTRKQQVMNQVASVLSKALGEDQAELAQRLRKRLESDAALTALLR
jgi:hypothetical protein